MYLELNQVKKSFGSGEKVKEVRLQIHKRIRALS